MITKTLFALTVFSVAGFIAKFVEANGETIDGGEVTLAMLGGAAE
jgi:hypothetical protein